MPSRIDEQTMVPLSLVAVLFSVGLGTTATGAFWISQVNERLTRIEHKLNLANSESSMIPSAHAESVK